MNSRLNKLIKPKSISNSNGKGSRHGNKKCHGWPSICTSPNSKGKLTHKEHTHFRINFWQKRTNAKGIKHQIFTDLNLNLKQQYLLL